MGLAPKLRSGASLAGFDDWARIHLEGMLATYGFKVEMSKSDPHYAMRRFRNGPRYITVEAHTHPGELPAGRVKLGTGSTDWPESDWNHIPLWRLIQASRPDYRGGDSILDHITLDAFLAGIAKDLQDYAMDFIGGDLARFKQLRADIARKRKLFDVHRGGPYAENTMAFMKASRLLKERYSSEEAA